MVVGYVKVGDMVEAKRLFDEMPQRNVASWNAMIWDFVKVVLDAMPEKSVASFTIMIDGYAKAGDGYLKGFEHVYGDIVSGVVDVNELGFLVKHMEGPRFMAAIIPHSSFSPSSTNSTTFSAPMIDKLNENSFKTWEHLALHVTMLMNWWIILIPRKFQPDLIMKQLELQVGVEKGQAAC
ncbi:hypothetical protein AHAS_Ahas02G0136700 [Arachis hypogaea]